MTKRLITQAQKTLKVEAQAITDLVDSIGDDFVQACKYMLAATGRVVVIGIGKSGHVGNKIAATLASTGTPAFFVHPAEASHGDLGMITDSDVVLALSNSGETDEILAIIPVIKRLGVPMIAMTGNPASTLSQCSDVHLCIGVKKEACPLNLAPTASTTATLALGDALAVALLDAKGFNSDDFARSHPGGKLGKRLLTYVSDVMRDSDNLPIASVDDSVMQAIMAMSSGGLGMVMICEDKKVIGIFTDGDLRRLCELNSASAVDLTALKVCDLMHRSPTTIQKTTLAVEALNLMQDRSISALPVLDEQGTVVGALNTHDLLRAGIA